jgi:hypothetical protein
MNQKEKEVEWEDTRHQEIKTGLLDVIDRLQKKYDYLSMAYDILENNMDDLERQLSSAETQLYEQGMGDDL